MAARRECVIAGGGCQFQVAANPDAKSRWAPWELGKEGWAAIYFNRGYIDKVAKETGVDARLIRAIMYYETSRGWVDFAPAWFDKNKSIRPMQVNLEFWGDRFGTRAEMKDPYLNILGGARMISAIQNNLAPGATVEQIATVYNDLGATSVNNYGMRVRTFYDEQPWNR